MTPLVHWTDGQLAPYIQDMMYSNQEKGLQILGIMCDWLEDQGHPPSRVATYRMSDKIYVIFSTQRLYASRSVKYGGRFNEHLTSDILVYQYPKQEWLESKRCKETVRTWVWGKHTPELSTYPWAYRIALQQGWIYRMKEDREDKIRYI